VVWWLSPFLGGSILVSLLAGSQTSRKLLALLVRRESVALVLPVLKLDVVPMIVWRAISSFEIVAPEEECLVGVFRRHLVPILLGNVLLDDARLTDEILALVQVDDLAAPLDELVMKHGRSREQFIPTCSFSTWYDAGVMRPIRTAKSLFHWRILDFSLER